MSSALRQPDAQNTQQNIDQPHRFAAVSIKQRHSEAQIVFTKAIAVLSAVRQYTEYMSLVRSTRPQASLRIGQSLDALLEQQVLHVSKLQAIKKLMEGTLVDVATVCTSVGISKTAVDIADQYSQVQKMIEVATNYL